MSNLVAIAYPDLGTAQTVAGELGQLTKEHSITLDDMVVIERRAGRQGQAPPVHEHGRRGRRGRRAVGRPDRPDLPRPAARHGGRRGRGRRGRRADRRRRRRQLHEGPRREPPERRRRGGRARPPEHARQGHPARSRSTAARSSSPRSTTRPRRGCRKRSARAPPPDRPARSTRSAGARPARAAASGAGAAGVRRLMRAAIEAHLHTHHVARVIYGAIIGLAVIVVQESHPPAAGVVVGSLIATAIAVALAELYSEVVATETRHAAAASPASISGRSAPAPPRFFGVAFPAGSSSSQRPARWSSTRRSGWRSGAGSG